MLSSVLALNSVHVAYKAVSRNAHHALCTDNTTGISQWLIVTVAAHRYWTVHVQCPAPYRHNATACRHAWHGIRPGYQCHAYLTFLGAFLCCKAPCTLYKTLSASPKVINLKRLVFSFTLQPAAHVNVQVQVHQSFLQQPDCTYNVSNEQHLFMYTEVIIIINYSLTKPCIPGKWTCPMHQV